MNINRILLFLLLLTSLNSSAQTVVKMVKEGGVYVVPCKVNGLKLSFIFDTGATDVTISLTEFNFMYKNGYLLPSDRTGQKQIYFYANGEKEQSEIVILREIEIQGLKLLNIRACVINKLNAPLLLGQSAINKLGAIQLDPISNTLTILNKKGSPNSSFDFNSQYTSCKDIDGNIYRTIRIGNQEWMAENLNVSHYRNGDSISHIEAIKEWSSTGTGAWCFFQNSVNNGAVYSKLYNWYAITDTRNICPVGWRMPTKSDFDELVLNLGGDSMSARLLRETGALYWNTDIGNNYTGFSARGGNWRAGDGIFYYDVKHCGTWWTTTRHSLNSDWDINHPWFLIIDGYQTFIRRDPYFSRNAGLSIRCIKE